MMKTKTLYTLLLLTLLIPLFSNAQSVTVQVDGENLYYSESGCSECLFAGDPDPRWKNRIVVGGSTHNWDTGLDDASCGWKGISNSSWTPTLTKSALDNIIFSFDGYEDDSGLCGANDNVCGGYSTLRTINNICDNNPYTWHTFIDSRSCGGGDYRTEWSYYWSYNEAPIISKPTANTILCLGSTTTLSITTNNDDCGRNMGRFYQWQISENTACSGAASWQNIPGATSATYTPNQIAGTRLYRCLATSGFSAVFTGALVVTSDCSRVTYNSYDGSSTASGGFPYGTGTNAPSIQSGICGSTVLPGTIHTLNTLQAPAVGAIANGTGYTWTTTGGTLSSSSGSSVTWTAPTTSGTYNIQLEYLDACGSANEIVICSVSVGSPNCDFAYVSATGSDAPANGGPNNPFGTLSYAIANKGARNHIKMANGIYVESSIVDLQTDLIIEGGYTVSSGIWSKSSTSTTNITFTGIGTGLQSGVTVGHTMGLRSSSDNNWKLIDLNISTTNAGGTTSSRGKSNYAIWINSSSNYKIIRCNITSGNASNGTAGTNGSAGHGGSSGGAGLTDSCNDSDLLGGGSGGSGGSNAWGGNGGSGGSGGQASGDSRSYAGCPGVTGGNNGGAGGTGGRHSAVSCGAQTIDWDNCNDYTNNGYNGSNGVGYTITGVNTPGNNYAAGNRPSAPAASVGMVYYLPSGISANAGHGRGGGGGGGGESSGGHDGGVFCNDNYGNSGGGGSQGGGGGQGGFGGYGGGASFCVFQNASSGTFTQTMLNAGTLGNGGNGGTGGNGGARGARGNNNSGCSSDRGTSGYGGYGGNGAKGGRGQDGANGISAQLYTTGTGSSNPSQIIAGSPVVGINYNNSKLCPNSVIELTKNSGSWTFSGDFSYIDNLADGNSSYDGTSAIVQIYTENTSGLDADVITSTATFPSYLQIGTDARPRPIITLAPTEICVGQTVDLAATNWGTELEYVWEIYNTTTATGSPVFTYTTDTPTAGPFSTGDTYLIKYQVREECCGWSRPSYIEFVVNPDITNIAITPSVTEICDDATTALIDGETPTGGNNSYTYQWSFSTDNASFTPISTGNGVAEDYDPMDDYAALYGIGVYYFKRDVDSGACSEAGTSIAIEIKEHTENPASIVTSPGGVCEGPATMDISILDGSNGLATLGTGASWSLYYGSVAPANIQRIGITTNPFSQTIISDGTYFLVAEGGCNSTTPVSVDIAFGGAGNVALTTDTDSGVDITKSCDDGSWTYYQDEEDDSKYIFAVEWGANAAAKTNATIEIGVNPSYFEETNGADTDAIQDEGTWAMRRFWNVNLNGASIDAANPVNVKFFYDLQEKTDIEAAMAAFAAASSTAEPEGFMWFKTQTGAFDGTQVTIPKVVNAVALTPSVESTENGVRFVQFNGLTSFSGGTGATGAGPDDNPLPVELGDFYGYAEGRSNLLKWITITEENTKFHVIERSASGTDEFEEIGRIDAAGNSVEELSYSLYDEYPLAIGYYRLRTIDIDGSESLSNIIVIKRGTVEDFSVISVYPVPTKSTAYIEFNSMNKNSVDVKLVDIAGRLLSEITIEANEGRNTHELDLSNLPHGVYFVKMNDGTNETISKLVKN